MKWRTAPELIAELEAVCGPLGKDLAEHAMDLFIETLGLRIKPPQLETSRKLKLHPPEAATQRGHRRVGRQSRAKTYHSPAHPPDEDLALEPLVGLSDLEGGLPSDLEGRCW